MYGEQIYFFERGTIMKYKKYVLLLLLVIFIGWNRVEAVNSDKCYYIGDGLKATFEFGKNYQDVYVDFVGDTMILKIYLIGDLIYLEEIQLLLDINLIIYIQMLMMHITMAFVLII